MGRFKRRQHGYSGAKGSNSWAESSTSEPGDASSNSSSTKHNNKNNNRSFRGSPDSRSFSPLDQRRIRSFLLAYRDGAWKLCHPQDYSSSSIHDATTDNTEHQFQDAISLTIGGHTFPDLTQEVFSAPYLEFPSTIGSKQRRTIHELCVDVDLYHCGAGDRGSTRRIVISIHFDGLDHVADLERPSTALPVRTCRPWFYRSDMTIENHPVDDAHMTEKEAGDLAQTPVHANNLRSKKSEENLVEKITRENRHSIQRMIDQPGRCLRDAHDSLDFAELDGADLSTMTSSSSPPTLESCSNPSTENETDASSWMLVDSAEKMRQCVREIADSHPSEIGFDLEMYNPSKYTQITCLLQLTTTDGKDYVVDVLSEGVWDEVSGLAPLFADPTIVKIGHAIGGMDVSSLSRDFGIFVVNSFDTYESARELRLSKGSGLASVCQHYGLGETHSTEYSSLKQVYQRTDWRKRPLTPEMMQYARYDVKFLVPLRLLLMRDLTRAQLYDHSAQDERDEARMVAKALATTLNHHGDYDDEDNGNIDNDDGMNGLDDATSSFSSTSADPDEAYFTSADTDSTTTTFDEDGDMYIEKQTKSRKSVVKAKELRMHVGLMRVITVSQHRCLSIWTDKAESSLKNSSLASILQRSAMGETVWSEAQMVLYERLVEWREECAKTIGTMPGLICSLDLLVAVAWKRPTCLAEFRRFAYFLPELLEEEKSTHVLQLFSLVQESVDESHSAESASPSTVPARSFHDAVVRGDLSQGNSKTRESVVHDSSNFKRRATTLLVATVVLGAVLTIVQKRRH
mmetsp:Transcript_18943/g.34363  ORF Transcript_18943/g.34363 Transcript_18943/m.34363 type:complete len:798 (-) Transcript_18943:725-3118(-)|eukprot:CAMPEP_0198298246 /NCGR_PEP_ID=MMETSP1449-20131203/40200_1 /TAXON_ID=420275 /ORGANISM="Attheya septentrionalis, Strain CCMP2084" /LENGTH=797 /DNA_ID=CAMNT_0043999467 /DNA_START=124 /DNA_END=2517 /DNA_ORIENTATION=-